ncbi:ribose-phosphate diphosphokinase [Pseudobacteriovorax antillogorgiicola]|uniref:ribose-phosphate diphosphokinase n=1 Tax=Pseudobacteriovorax antillogorgiicola TaxID=1513793 RepID=A0A1Y6BDP2_9BACT|nr:ribose-phosphate diphosphokinase [Pseudobacteriovorax antillogorgiicola]TCS58677.1 ribose-phosphate pyrophosphokinase [Pseudobacteriovorax antillogorgiicola]SME95987.1 ribose-phosphate pyrophosphokinase [Pseudobacteriovorax antillogorgiicola]
MNPDLPIKVIVGTSNPGLGKKLCETMNIDPCKSEVIEFSEGNTFVRILENVRGRDVYIVQGVSYPVDRNFMELLFWVDAAKLASAAQVTAVIPFFSYAKADKKDEPRVSIRARVCADALEAAGVDRVLTMDLHSPQIQGFFKRPVDHMNARSIICEYIQTKNLDNLVVASADVGYGKNAFKFSDRLKVPTVIGNKIRVDHSETAQVWNVVGDVKDKNVLIVDDIVFTGGSLISMTEAVKAMGAKKVYAAVTHGVLTPGATKKIDESSLEELVITDTVEYRFQDLSPKVKVLSVAGSFANAIKSIHEYKSISKLFPE